MDGFFTFLLFSLFFLLLLLFKCLILTAVSPHLSCRVGKLLQLKLPDAAGQRPNPCQILFLPLSFVGRGTSNPFIQKYTGAKKLAETTAQKDLRKKCINRDDKIPRQKCVNHTNVVNLQKSDADSALRGSMTTLCPIPFLTPVFTHFNASIYKIKSL